MIVDHLTSSIDWCGSCGFNFYNFPFLNSPHLLYCVLLMVCQYCKCDRLSGIGHGMNWFPLSYQLFLTMCMGKQGRRLITWAIPWWAMSIIIILSTPSKLHMLQFESKTFIILRFAKILCNAMNHFVILIMWTSSINDFSHILINLSKLSVENERVLVLWCSKVWNN